MKPGLDERTINAGRAVLAGRRRGLGAFFPFAGPAIIASIAYMDPGNFATNIQSGAEYGYTLLWVVLLANIVAMLFQSLSAKLGIITGRNLAEQCRDHYPKPLVIFMWIASELAAMATDLAEFLGAAIGLSLLFNLPLLVGLSITAVATFAFLGFTNSGFRAIEVVIAIFVVTIGVCYLMELLLATPDWGALLHHSVTPSLPDAGSVTLAVGIVGATVMPHAIYLHSSLTQNRIPTTTDAERRQVLRYSNREVLVALGFAGLVNMAMVTMAAVVFHSTGNSDVASIETAYHTLIPLMGIGAAGIFMLSLLVSGFSSSIVGTMAGQVIMQGFVNFSIPLWFRRAVTMAPAFVVVAMGVDTTRALVLSQVVLSLTLPIPMFALLLLTSRRDVMGAFVNTRLVIAAATLAAAGVFILNVILLLQFAEIDVLSFFSGNQPPVATP
ncbi:MAG: Nramp family divalent metal transporter [Alphaproteobacteria bacterium]